MARPFQYEPMISAILDGAISQLENDFCVTDPIAHKQTENLIRCKYPDRASAETLFRCVAACFYYVRALGNAIVYQKDHERWSHLERENDLDLFEMQPSLRGEVCIRFIRPDDGTQDQAVLTVEEAEALVKQMQAGIEKAKKRMKVSG